MTQPFDYQIFDIMGHTVLAGNGTQKVEVRLRQGIYIIKVKINDSWHTQKLIMY
ncbi:MAG: T9SS type A sorting domain-containing protein [Brumimicrobium sp.]|nr:T9SS type A sorting domain-containing protein [Brumimicrobium sp.]